jgi:hypothetical protein
MVVCSPLTAEKYLLAVDFPLRILELNFGILLISLSYNYSDIGQNI